MAKATKPLPQKTNRGQGPRPVMKDDGAIRFGRHEQFCLRMAEGLEKNQACKAVGLTTNGGGATRYTRDLIENPVIQLRIENLKSEKEELEGDPIWGEATWMANQLWRESQATSDTSLMIKAAELRYKIAEKKAANTPSGGGDDGDPATPKRGVGAPKGENPQTSKRNVVSIRDKLVHLGIKTEEPEEELS